MLIEKLVQCRDALLGAIGLRQPCAQLERHALDVTEVALDRQRGIGVLGNHQAGLPEIDARVVLREQPGECVEGSAHQVAARREKSRGRKPKSARHAP